MRSSFSILTLHSRVVKELEKLQSKKALMMCCSESDKRWKAENEKKTFLCVHFNSLSSDFDGNEHNWLCALKRLTGWDWHSTTTSEEGKILKFIQSTTALRFYSSLRITRMAWCLFKQLRRCRLRSPGTLQWSNFVFRSDSAMTNYRRVN